MVAQAYSFAKVFGGLALAISANTAVAIAASSDSKVNIDGKVVLANVDKHTASYRVAKVKKDIKPRKASVLSPKQFPVTIEIWNGARPVSAWEPQSITEAGIYTLRYQNGRWNFAKHQPRSKAAPTKPAAPAATPKPAQTATTKTTGSSATSNRYAYRRPTYRRSTGSVPRVVRGTGRMYYGGRIPFLRNFVGNLLWLYRFVRDEEDRDLIRDIIIGREIDREIEREFWDRLEGDAVNLPAEERLEFERAMRDLRDLDEQDLRDLEDATDEQWGQVRDELGDQVTDNAWRDLESDFSNIEIDDMSSDQIEGLDEVGIDSLESNVDLGDLDGGEVADVGIGDLGGTLDDVDVGDLGGGIEDIDIGDLGGGFGADLGADSGVEPADNAGGNLAVGAGNVLGDLDVLGSGGTGGLGGAGGGFDYDNGGFGDFGGQMGGGDFGGGDFGGPEFGGGDFGGGDFGGGDFGGGDFGGGDFGGGFDDFGGGGFDDFGGGDFGGDFDF